MTSSSPRLEFTPIVDMAWLTVLRARPPEPVPGPPVVVFGSWRTKDKPPEFRATVAALNRPALFIMEHDFGFYATQERVARIQPLIEAEMAELHADEIDTMGFSIGGYGAMAWAELVPVRHVMSFAPRWSPDPAIVADPRARRKMAAHSGQLALPVIGPGMARVRYGMILHGLRGPDNMHLPFFPQMPHIDHWVAPAGNHFMADWLRRRGQLATVTAAVLNGDRPAAERLMARLAVWRAQNPLIRGLRPVVGQLERWRRKRG